MGAGVDRRQDWLNGIDAFLFDLGNVLVRFSHETMMVQMAAVTGQSVLRIRQLLVDEGLLVALESGELTEEAFVRAFQNDAKKPFSSESFLLAMADIFTPIPETVALLPRLKSLGKRLVLVSNTSSIHFCREQRRQPWLSQFHAHVLSYKIGIMKPHAAFYRHALNESGTSADRCLFIDDIAANVEGASEAGFQTHHFVNVDDFLRLFPFENSVLQRSRS